MAKLEARALLREFDYNGVRIPDPAPQMSVEQVRDLLTPHSRDRDRIPHRTGRHRDHTALHLQPCHRIEGVSRGASTMSKEELVELFLKKAAEPPPEANLDSGEASPIERILRSRTSRLEAIRQYVAPEVIGSQLRRSFFRLWDSETRSRLRPALPSLADIRAEYSHEVNAELVYELCAALAREGLGTAETWKKSGGNALAFAQHAMMSGIGAERGDLLRRNVDYHLEVSDQLGRAGSDAELESGQLVVTIECGGSGYFRIGPALDALEAEAEGLGAAFYWALTLALYRVMRIYNHDDALMYEERMRDYAAEDDEENRGQYEFPEVEKALPECIRKTLKRECPDWRRRDRDLLRRFRNGRFSSWFERLRRIQRLSRLPLKQSREYP